LAIGPRGRHLAVAGSPDHAVHVYALEDVIGGKPQPRRQELQSVGTTIQQAAWVNKDGATGLLLRRTATAVNAHGMPGAVEGDLIFEVAKAPRLTNDAKGWRAVAQTTASEEDRKRWRERHNVVKISATARLPKGMLVKDRRLVAVAYVDGGEPGLGIYD